MSRDITKYVFSISKEVINNHTCRVKDTGVGIKDVICSFVGGVITVGGIEPAPNVIATDGARDSASAFVVVHLSWIASGARDAS